MSPFTLPDGVRRAGAGLLLLLPCWTSDAVASAGATADPAAAVLAGAAAAAELAAAVGFCAVSPPPIL